MIVAKNKELQNSVTEMCKAFHYMSGSNTNAATNCTLVGAPTPRKKSEELIKRNNLESK